MTPLRQSGHDDWHSFNATFGSLSWGLGDVNPALFNQVSFVGGIPQTLGLRATTASGFLSIDAGPPIPGSGTWVVTSGQGLVSGTLSTSVDAPSIPEPSPLALLGLGLAGLGWLRRKRA